MNIENLVKMVEFSFEIDKIKLQTKLENIINCGEVGTNKKVKKIRSLINKLALLELQENKFKSMTDDDNNNK